MGFRYFSSSPGCVVSRFGTDAIIGGRYVPGKGYEINPDAVVAIPENEITRYIREYNNAIRAGDLIERSESDHSKFVAGLSGAKVVDKSSTIVTGDQDETDAADGVKNTGKRSRKSRSGGKGQ